MAFEFLRGYIENSDTKKDIKKLEKEVAKINTFTDAIAKLSDAELQAKTDEFKTRLANGETLDQLLPEAYAVVREASTRVLGMRHFDVQLMGGVILHQGRIAEMKTGEGKTLVATLPVYLNALTGKGVHVITVNDYLATRDSEQMGKLYNFLGLSVGLIVHGLDFNQRKEAYAADITYGTNNEFGFDYLRDNMVMHPQNMVQRELNFALVDEVDSILIDEARTPLIISGVAEKPKDYYTMVSKIIPRLKADQDYTVDEKAKNVVLTEEGVSHVEKLLGIDNLSDESNMELAHHVNQGLRAHVIMHRDRDYVVKDGQVIIVDEFTGRLMFGRRYSEGLHQAIEAKEGVKIEKESQTLATITFQNYFRMYKKLAGMTGTALSEANEFLEIYGLSVLEIPTNRPIARNDMNDVVYKTERAKFNAVADDVVEAHKAGQPVLVGTISIEKSEELSRLLKNRGVKHEVLNAKYHDKEAEIVAQAGKKGAVTIATNMAGRGTDIILGGNAEFMAKNDMRKQGYTEEMIEHANSFFDTTDEEILAARQVYADLVAKYKAQLAPEAQAVRESGGLLILGTERHESRRIDNQLRGRAGRQGDPGATRFYVSMEDDLMRLFGGDRTSAVMEKLGYDETMPIENKIITGSIENAQKKIEGRNFDVRKNVLNYDDVMNKQREIIYSQRQSVLEGEDISESLHEMVTGSIQLNVNTFCSGNQPEHWNLASLRSTYLGWLLNDEELRYTDEQLKTLKSEDICDYITNKALAILKLKEQQIGSENMRELERVVLLKTVDSKWMEHIDAMDELKKGIGLRSYGQHDPVSEYRVEGFNMFDEMIANIQEETTKLLIMANLAKPVKREAVAKETGTSGGGDNSVKRQPIRRAADKVGRNDPCPCGSGKKYKKCCGRTSADKDEE